MSILHSKNEFKKFEDTDDENQRTIDIIKKFKTYRQGLELNERKFKEAKIVIDHLKNELKILSDVEKSSRNQLSAAQNRIIQLHESLSKFIFISDQQCQNEKTSQQLEQKIEQLSKIIKEAQEKIKTLSCNASNQLTLIEENKNLVSVLKTKEFEYDLLKIEIQSLTNDKNKQRIEFEQRIKSLTNELEQSKREAANIKTECDKTILMYKKQIQENEQIIEEYENERRSLLEDFEQPKNSENKSVKFTCDSTVLINTEERLSTQSMDSTNRHGEICDPEDDVFQCSSYAELKSTYEPKSKVPRGSSQSFKKISGKQKPQLCFLTQSQETSHQAPQTIKPKRKLFSTNCNHYGN